MATGWGKVTCCHPLAVSSEKVAWESSVPSLAQRLPMWMPVLAAAL